MLRFFHNLELGNKKMNVKFNALSFKATAQRNNSFGKKSVHNCQNEYENSFIQNGKVTIPIDNKRSIEIKSAADCETFSFVTSYGEAGNVTETMDFYNDGCVFYYFNDAEPQKATDEQILNFVDSLNDNNVFMPQSIKDKTLDIESKKNAFVQKKNMESLEMIANSLAQINKTLTLNFRNQ